jgi:hypothetical protein
LLAILEVLGQIKEVCPASLPTSGPELAWQVAFTQLTENQQALYHALDLGRYRSP